MLTVLTSLCFALLQLKKTTFFQKDLSFNTFISPHSKADDTIPSLFDSQFYQQFKMLSQRWGHPGDVPELCRRSATCGVGSVRGILSLSGNDRCLHGIKVGLLLELTDVLLVANSLVAEPVADLARRKTQDTGFEQKTEKWKKKKKSHLTNSCCSKRGEWIYLRNGYSALFGKFLFGFFARVWVGQVGIEILIQDLCGLLAEVAPFASVETSSRKGTTWLCPPEFLGLKCSVACGHRIKRHF